MHRSSFTDRLRQVLQMAREDAERRGHTDVDTGHQLLAIISEAEGTGAKALERLGVDVVAVRQKIEDAMMRNGTGQLAGQPDLPYTRAGTHVLERAMTEGSELRHTYVGTEHLPLGLWHDREGHPRSVP